VALGLGPRSSWRNDFGDMMMHASRDRGAFVVLVFSLFRCFERTPIRSFAASVDRT
jgi:hypothetical protein